MRYNSWKKLLKICTPKGKKKPLINLAVRQLSRDYFCSGYDGQDVDYGDDLHENLYEGLPVGKEEAEQIMKGVNLKSEWYVVDTTEKYGRKRVRRVSFLDPAVFWMTLIQTQTLIPINIKSNLYFKKLGFASKQ